MRKLIFFLLALAVCLSLFTLAASATEGEGEGEAAVHQESETENPLEAAQENTFLDSLYKAYEDNKSELFSIASTVVSLVLVFVYQKGLLPTVKGGLTLIEGQVKALREVSHDTKVENQKTSDETRALALQMAQSSEKMQQILSQIASRAELEQSKEEQLGQLRECMLWQSELLGEVFLHSSLPEYEKERVAKLVERVKGTLVPDGSED